MKKGVGCLLCAALLCVFFNIYLTLSAQETTPLPAQNYFIVANYFNSEASLSYSLPQLTRLLTLLGSTDNLYLSIFENGSEDQTPSLLQQFAETLPIPHTVVTCNFTGSFIQQTANTTQKEDFDLKRIVARKRYPRMAALRNLAMRPLYEGKVTFKNTNLPTKVLFINDIYFTAEQVISLLSTNEGTYDMACGLDFYELFYDILVTRDVEGYWFAGYFPYARHEKTRRSVMAGRPFPVYSCWNGMVAMTAEPFIQHHIRFRGRIYEPNEHCECVQSECLLVCSDFRNLGYDQIYINPQVRVAYEWKHHILYNSLITPLYQWGQFFLAAYVFSRQPPVQGLGCGMPPYWTTEDAQYMPTVPGECPLPFDPDRPSLNYSRFDYLQEVDYAKRYEERLVEECIA
jgi:hypothetical protein